MERNANRRLFGSAKGNKSGNFFFLAPFTVILFILTGYLGYPYFYGLVFKGTAMDCKSDAEISAEFQAHKEEFNQVVQKELQAQEEIRLLTLEINKKNEIIKNQLKQNAEINRNNEELKQKESGRLLYEIHKNEVFLSRARGEKREEIKKFLKGLELSDYSLTRESLMFAKSYYYQEPQLFYNRRTSYHIAKGLILFGENNQPEPQYVVDNLDAFHASGNIKLAARKFAAKFGANATIYVHIEGKWYLFLKVLTSETRPDDEY
jgi:hypothetical protein